MLSKSALKRARFAGANARLARPTYNPVPLRSKTTAAVCGTLDCLPYVPNYSDRPHMQDQARAKSRATGSLLVLA